MYYQLDPIIRELRGINQSLNSFAISDGIALVGLFILILYTYYIYKMAKAAEETLSESIRPIVSCDIKSGKNYYFSQQLEVNPKLIYDTRFIVTNRSKYNLEVFVNLNFKIDGKSTEIIAEYTGKKAWPLTSFQEINGHFNFSDKFDFENHSKITIDLEVSYRSGVKKLYKNPVQHWYFDKGEKVWINSIGLHV